MRGGREEGSEEGEKDVREWKGKEGHRDEGRGGVGARVISQSNYYNLRKGNLDCWDA